MAWPATSATERPFFIKVTVFFYGMEGAHRMTFLIHEASTPC